MEQRQVLEEKRASLALDVEEGRQSAEKELKEVERELEQLRRFEERSALAAKAREERDKEGLVRKRAEAIQAMDKMFARMEREFERDLERLKSRSRPRAEDVRAFYVLARQTYALSHDLRDLTGERKYYRTWNINAQLGQLADLIPEMFVGSLPKPPIERPWAKLHDTARSAT